MKSTKPGTTLALHYPVVLIGVGQATIHEEESELTSVPAKQLTGRLIMDASGVLYTVLEATAARGEWWHAKRERSLLVLKREGRAGIDRLRRLVSQAAGDGSWEDCSTVEELRQECQVPRTTER